MSSHNTYEMWFETVDGEKIKAFTWTGTLEKGMEKVYNEAKVNNYQIKNVWGEVKSKS